MIKEFLDKNFKTFVTKIDENYQVTFQGLGGQEGYITFRPAKKGWNNKPLSQNTYLVGDADMYQVIDNLKLYMSLDEKDIGIVKKTFTDISLNVLEEWLSSN